MMDVYLRQLYYLLQSDRKIDAWSLGWKKKNILENEKMLAVQILSYAWTLYMAQLAMIPS